MGITFYEKTSYTQPSVIQAPQCSVSCGRWTNGRFRSTLHRVVNTNERFSTPFFLAPNWDAQVTPDCLCLFQVLLGVCHQMADGITDMLRS